MAVTILHKRSATEGAVPTAGSLQLGELAVNTATGRLFTKTGAGAVVGIGPTKVTVDVQSFTAGGTWTKPANAALVLVDCAGGGAGGEKAGASAAGRGGAAGQRVERWIPAANVASTESVTIGAGGAPGTAANTDTKGGDTSFGTHVVAAGGGTPTDPRVRWQGTSASATGFGSGGVATADGFVGNGGPGGGGGGATVIGNPAGSGGSIASTVTRSGSDATPGTGGGGAGASDQSKGGVGFSGDNGSIPSGATYGIGAGGGAAGTVTGGPGGSGTRGSGGGGGGVPNGNGGAGGTGHCTVTTICIVP
jgi:hypothetical protein